MATLAQDHSLATDPTFIARVEGALLRVVMGFLNGGTLTSPQLILARKIIFDPTTHAAIIARGCVTESAIQARNGVQTDVLDTEILGAVNTVVSRYVV